MIEIKEIILKSEKSYKGTQQLMQGSTTHKDDFSTLSVTGGVVNLKNAVKMWIYFVEFRATTDF